MPAMASFTWLSRYASTYTGAVPRAPVAVPITTEVIRSGLPRARQSLYLFISAMQISCWHPSCCASHTTSNASGAGARVWWCSQLRLVTNLAHDHPQAWVLQSRQVCLVCHQARVFRQLSLRGFLQLLPQAVHKAITQQQRQSDWQPRQHHSGRTDDARECQRRYPRPPCRLPRQPGRCSCP